jgi:hypothetical protein
MTGRLRPGFRRAAIVAEILLAPVALHALWDYIEVRRLIREVAAIRDRGEPVTQRDLGPTSPTTEEQKRASRLYLASGAIALDAYGTDRTLDTDLQAAGLRGEMPPASRASLQERMQSAVEPYAEAFPLLDRANALDFTSLGAGTDHSYRAASFWNLTRLNSARSALECLSGNADEAATIAATSIRLKRVLRASRAGLGFGRTTREDWVVPFLLSHCTPSAASLESLDRIMAQFEPGTLVQDLLAERVAFLGYVWPYYGIDARAPEHFNFRRWSPLEVVIRPWRTHQLVDQFKRFADAIAAARKPMPERKAALTAIVQRSEPSNRPGTLPSGWMPASIFLQAANPRWADGSVMWNAFRTAVAVERYRHDNDSRFPSALADLVPRYLTAIPADPDSGSSLLYKSIDGGYTIYGVGPNGLDDGGDIAPGKPKWPSGQPTESRDSGITIRHQ